MHTTPVTRRWRWARAVTSGSKDPKSTTLRGRKLRSGYGAASVRVCQPSAAAGLRPLPTRQVVTKAGPHPTAELVTVTARPEPCWFSPAVALTYPI